MLRRILPFFVGCLATVTMVDAQVATNVQELQKAAQGISLKERSEYTKAMSLAKQRNWPLSIRSKSGRLATLIGVDAFNYPKYFITDNNSIAAATTRTNQLWAGGASGLNLSGNSANMKNKIGIWDGGSVLSNHVELTGRVTQKDNPSSTDNHATHVAGTMIATGLNPSAKGMSHGAQGLIAYDFNNSYAEQFTEAAGLLISNHSYNIVSGWNFNETQNRWEFWGRPNETEDYKFGYYSSDAQLLDSMAYNAPFYLIVKSAGNNRGETGPAVGEPYFRYNAQNQMAAAGNRPSDISSNDSYGSIPWDANAKNILTVGAVRGIPGGYNRPEDVVMSSFSGWGPTDDGRIKPDVVADGVNVLSTYATGTSSYASLSGTSMSTPNTSGSLFLLQEHYSKLKSGAFLRSATIKGLAIHTTEEAGTTPGPDYQNGWGLLNVQKAAAVISASVASNNGTSSEHLMYENVFNSTTTSFTTTVVATGKEPIRATISWTDVKGDVDQVNVLNNPAKKLINDLDIRITSGSRTFRPWTLDPAFPANAAVKGDNITDNVERIDIDSTVAGETYTITVTHKGTLVRGQQAYSLLVSGVGGVAHCASAATTNAGGRIDSVSLQTIRYANPTGGTTYVNNTAIAAYIEPTQAVPFRVRVSSADASDADKMVKIFIDYNNDGDFLDANELVATSGILKNNQVFSGSFNTPGTLTIGSTYRARVVMVETSAATDVVSCGTYTRGETEDFRLIVTNPSTDFTISEVLTPTVADCADNKQYITVNIRNNGSVPKTSIPVSIEVKNGSTTVATFNGTYPGAVPGLSNVSFTLQTPFVTTENTTYTILATANVTGDQNSANNTLTTSLTIGKKADNPSVIGTICNTNALLKVNNPVSNSNYFWYNSANAVAPFAAGSSVSTSSIPGNKTFYVANETKAQIGFTNKMINPSGGYNPIGNFLRFNNSVPLTIESVRLYVGNPGSVDIIVANLGPVSGNSYSYTRLSSVTLDVTATNPNPQPGAVSGNPAADTGAVYYLNLPVNEVGDHILLITGPDRTQTSTATFFRNNGIVGTTYPIAISNVMSITGNSVNLIDANADPNPFYYFFYDMKIRTGTSCPSNRVEVVVGDAPTPVVTKVGDSLVSSVTGVSMQWFKNDVGINGATSAKFKPIESGSYKVVVVDALGCQKTSAPLQVTITALPPEVVAREIKLSLSPNPNKGIFNLSFEVKEKADLAIELLNSAGQRVFSQSYPGFNGTFSKQMNVGNVNDGYYVLKILHNKKTYLQKVIVIK
ncbi:S8 family serine peptidase [Sediminibacterium goheungense]|uniref:Putative secreted protein (Por secretion system target) n=1 Tax=Sediminibacterium goheungense TaxID=1086393 RepID=A0A4R6IY13_9BACT|nr:S8 family serine peptidase [Sediminibacterium goheungense]TDO26866.1 putative secreted protein (Por secretion system target) [Sediminibacterium goheungense]